MKLREYEKTWVRRIRAAKSKRLLIVGPTGSGKTVVAAHLIRASVQSGKRILFVAHRRELIDQCVARLDERGVHDVGVVLAGRTNDPKQPVQVASLQTLQNRKLPKADEVWVDEAHHASAASIQRILKAYPKALIYGLTATPTRLDGKPLGDIFDKIVEGPTVVQLIDQGFLSNPRVFSWPEELRGIAFRGGDFKTEQLSQRLSKRKLVDNVVTRWKVLAEGKPTVVYAVDIRHAKQLVASFKRAGVSTRLLTGETPHDQREDILASLEVGRTNVIVNVGVLTEGWDSHVAAVGVLARPTLSLTLYLQMCGRFMRPGKESLIIDHGGNAIRFGRPSELREWSLEKAQPRARVDSPVKECPSCGSVNYLGARKCSGCGYVFWEDAPPEHIAKQLVELTVSPRERALKLLKEGRSPRQIAAELGVDDSTVCKWARENGIETAKVAKVKHAASVKPKGLQLLKEGRLSSRQIAAELGVSNTMVGKWARENGIEIERGTRLIHAASVKSRALEMLKKGRSSSRQIAAELGVNGVTVGKWARENGIETEWVTRKSHAASVKSRALEMLKEGRSVRQIVAELRVYSSTVYRWKATLNG